MISNELILFYITPTDLQHKNILRNTWELQIFFLKEKSNEVLIKCTQEVIIQLKISFAGAYFLYFSLLLVFSILLVFGYKIVKKGESYEFIVIKIVALDV